MLRKIFLHGALKKFSEQPIEMAVHDNKDVFSALKSRFPEFKKFMWDNPVFHLVLSDSGLKNPRPVHPEFFASPFIGCDEIHIVPSVEGAGIESAIAAFFVEMGVSAATAATLASITINIAVSMVIGAITQMLAPQTQNEGSERPEQKPSFLYNGPENVIEQGYQVPIVYGTHMTGSVVASAGVTIEQIPIASKQTPTPSGTTTPSPAAEEWQWAGDGGGGPF